MNFRVYRLLSILMLVLATPRPCVAADQKTTNGSPAIPKAKVPVVDEILVTLDVRKQLATSVKELWESTVKQQPVAKENTLEGFQQLTTPVVTAALSNISASYTAIFTPEELVTLQTFLQTSAGQKFAIHPEALDTRLRKVTEEYAAKLQEVLVAYVAPKETPK